MGIRLRLGVTESLEVLMMRNEVLYMKCQVNASQSGMALLSLPLWLGLDVV